MRTRLATAALATLAAVATPAMAQDDPGPDTHGLAPFFTPAGGGAIAPDAEGFLHRWLLLEPLIKPNRSNAGFTGTYVREALSPATYPGRFNAVPRDGEHAKAPLGSQGGAPQWHALDAKLFDVKLFNFAEGFNKPTYGVIFWAVTVIDSPREQRGVRLAIGSNSASRWWLNGEEAAGLYGDRRMVQDDVVSAPLTLHRGRNILRGAVINGPGLSDFCVRLLGADGLPLRDITTRVQ